MKVWRIGILFAAIAILGSMVVCQPGWLASNEFLLTIMTHELVSILVVILTITLASVANIHLAITRMLGGVKGDKTAATNAANGVRREINTNAWTIFWAFVLAVAALVWKGAYPNNLHIVAAAHAIGLTILLVNVMILHDIYRATFGLARADMNGPGGVG